jgi:hypothetical protein
MKILYFTDTDAALIEFSDAAVEETREVSEDVYLDLDVQGALVRMTVDSVTPYGQTLPPPVKGAFPVTQDWLDEARRTGREAGRGRIMALSRAARTIQRRRFLEREIWADVPDELLDKPHDDALDDEILGLSLVPLS